MEEVDVSCNINGKITVTGNGIQQRYVEGIQKRVQYECSRKFGTATGGMLNDTQWLLTHLEDHHWRICREDGPLLASCLGLRPEHESYYPRVKVWLPDKRWGHLLMPTCPTCMRTMKPHGFQPNQFGRIAIDQTDHYYVISRL